MQVCPTAREGEVLTSKKSCLNDREHDKRQRDSRQKLDVTHLAPDSLPCQCPFRVHLLRIQNFWGLRVTSIGFLEAWNGRLAAYPLVT